MLLVKDKLGIWEKWQPHPFLWKLDVRDTEHNEYFNTLFTAMYQMPTPGIITWRLRS